MRRLTPLDEIHVPDPKPDESYGTAMLGRDFRFQGLKALLAAGDCDKAGDRHAGLAADAEDVREAARTVLSGLTLEHLYNHPLTDDQGRIDSVMRVNYDVDRETLAAIATMTVGELKDRLLTVDGSEIAEIGRALTGVMAAAVAKLCDVHELILAASKISRPTRARTSLGLPGSLSSRLQPNHPTDDPLGITFLCYWGLSLGSGDALIGMNPAVDTVDNVERVLRLLDAIRRRTGAPTQICVLSHIKTQLACLERGAPVEILFQSLGGTEATNLLEFDVSVDLLDHGYRTMAARGPIRNGRQFMYFETGQGSEFTYGRNHGIDMTTAEALCYGLARRYDPFMVNNVTGFIGPETHLDSFEMVLANLQDHFMGKLMGLPMGMAPCYTLHARTILEGQQMAAQMLTAAGANYFMDVALNNDRMLAYFDTSGHDVQTLREVHDRATTPEYEEWALGRGILRRDEAGKLRRGPRWGDARQFCETDAEFNELMARTPAVYGLATAGPRPADSVSRLLKFNHAVARESVRAELRLNDLAKIADFRFLETAVHDKDSHLASPDAGSRLSAASLAGLSAEGRQVQILVSDGLSAEAVHHNLPELLPVLMDGLDGRKFRTGRPIAVRYGRVKLAEQIAEALDAELVVHLLGERPGGDASASRSLSAYLVYRLAEGARAEAARFSGNPEIRFEYTVVSNIYPGGLPPVEAGAVILEKIVQIFTQRAAGNRLATLAT